MNTSILAPVRRCGVIVALFFGLAQSAAQAAERKLAIEAPSLVDPGSHLVITIAAAADAGQGERVGFLHAEASSDAGKTWTPLVYMDKAGEAVNHTVTLPVTAGTREVLVRARVAFRGGLAGDVDFRGAAIRWEGSWKDWGEPPGQSVVVAVGR